MSQPLDRTRSTSRRNEYWAVNVVFLSTLALSLLAAIVIPDDILDHSQRAREFTESIAAFVGSVDRMGDLSNIPQATRMFFASWASCTPILAVLYLISIPKASIERIAERRILAAVGIVGAVLAAWWWLIAKWRFDPARLHDHLGWHDAIVASMVNSRFGLGIWGGLMWTGLAMSAAATLFLIIHARGIFAERGSDS